MTQVQEASHEGWPGMRSLQLPVQVVGGSTHMPTPASGPHAGMLCGP